MLRDLFVVALVVFSSPLVVLSEDTTFWRKMEVRYQFLGGEDDFEYDFTLERVGKNLVGEYKGGIDGPLNNPNLPVPFPHSGTVVGSILETPQGGFLVTLVVQTRTLGGGAVNEGADAFQVLKGKLKWDKNLKVFILEKDPAASQAATSLFKDALELTLEN